MNPVWAFDGAEDVTVCSQSAISSHPSMTWYQHKGTEFRQLHFGITPVLTPDFQAALFYLFWSCIYFYECLTPWGINAWHAGNGLNHQQGRGTLIWRAHRLKNIPSEFKAILRLFWMPHTITDTLGAAGMSPCNFVFANLSQAQLTACLSYLFPVNKALFLPQTLCRRPFPT